MAAIVARPRNYNAQELRAFFMSHQARLWEITIASAGINVRQVFADRESAMLVCDMLVESGCDIEQTEVLSLESINDFPYDRPPPTVPRNCKVVIHFRGNGNLWIANWRPNISDPASRVHEVTHTTEAIPDFNPSIGMEEMNTLRRRLMDFESQAFAIPQEMMTPHTITAGSAFAATMDNDVRRRFVDGDWGPRPTYPLPPSNEVQEHKDWEARKEAAKKALSLFISCLTEQEKKEFESQGTITIWNKLGVFRIEVTKSESVTGQKMPPTYNVHANDQTYCLNVGTQRDNSSNSACNFPYYDHILAQMLLLKTDPIKFINVANKK